MIQDASSGSELVRNNALAPMLLVMLTLAGCDRSQPTSSSVVAKQPEPRPATEPSAPSFKPIAYFQDKCARCHGPYGMFYGDEFGKSLNDAELRHKVHDMVFGAAQSSLSEAEVNVLTAYHRSMVQGSPFLIVTSAGPQASGEATSGATLEIQNGDERIPVELIEHSWTANVSADASSMTISAILNGVRTTIPLRAGEVSHPAGSAEISR